MHLRTTPTRSRLALVLGVAAATLSATVAAAPPALADRITGDQGDERVTLRGSDDVWHLTDATFAQSSDRGGDYPVRVAGESLTVNGGTVTGEQKLSLTWQELKKHANGAAFYVTRDARGDYTLNGSVGRNVSTDMFRQTSGSVRSVHFHRSYSEDVRDDIWSLARRKDGKTTYRITDALVEGYTGISWRNTGSGADAPFRLDIDGMVMHIKPQALSSGTCGRWAAGRGAGSPFKMDRFRGSGELFHIRNTVIWLEEGNRDGCWHRWPAATYENVTVVWTGPGPLPGDVPDGVSVTTDLSVYEQARAAWFERG